MSELSAELQSLMDANPQAPTMELLIPDLNGILRGKRIQRTEFEVNHFLAEVCHLLL